MLREIFHGNSLKKHDVLRAILKTDKSSFIDVVGDYEWNNQQ